MREIETQKSGRCPDLQEIHDKNHSVLIPKAEHFQDAIPQSAILIFSIPKFYFLKAAKRKRNNTRWNVMLNMKIIWKECL